MKNITPQTRRMNMNDTRIMQEKIEALLEAMLKAEQQLDYGQYDAAQDILRAAISEAKEGAA
jgi:hypothetical protein